MASNRWSSLKVPFPVSKCVLGLDPGASGGVSLINIQPWQACAWGLATASRGDVASLFRFLAQYKPVVAFLEEVGSRPGQDCRASFSFGMAYERLWMGATCFDLKCRLIKPQDWQRAIGAPPAPKDKTLKAHIRKRMHKNDLKDMAQRLYPYLKVNLQTSDALLIGHYGAQVVSLESNS